MEPTDLERVTQGRGAGRPSYRRVKRVGVACSWAGGGEESRAGESRWPPLGHPARKPLGREPEGI